jgi:hypothetical protein
VDEHYVQTALPTYGGLVTDMANLATTTSVDHKTVDVLTKTFATFSDQLAAKDFWGKAKEA